MTIINSLVFLIIATIFKISESQVTPEKQSYLLTLHHNVSIKKNLNIDSHAHDRPMRQRRYNNPDWIFPDQQMQRKCQIKCNEYIQIYKRYALEERRYNRHVNLAINKTKRMPPNTILEMPVIAGGYKVELQEFAHMVALGWRTNNGSIEFHCGGTLITEKWILSAAHCTHGPLGRPKIARVGTTSLNDEEAKDVEIKRIYRHPTYKPPAMYADIALLELKIPVVFGFEIQPACLYSNVDYTPDSIWVTGWGATGYGDESSPILMKAELDIMNNVECNILYNGSRAVPKGITSDMVCAADLKSDWTKDTCAGDSGGPAQVLHPNSEYLYYVIGVTSFGKVCAMKNSPGIYIRVSSYLDWIEPIVWSNTT